MSNRLPMNDIPRTSFRDTLCLDCGVVVLEVPSPMSADDYVDFCAYLDLVRRRTRRSLRADMQCAPAEPPPTEKVTKRGHDPAQCDWAGPPGTCPKCREDAGRIGAT